MCGIIGYLGGKPAKDILLDGLRRLEYRGYDSAGVALADGSVIDVVRSVGKVAELSGILEKHPSSATAGIAHTRWATHGVPSERNAHPHRDCSGRIAVVHNGIIENYQALRRELESEGHGFASETDSEVLAHLIEKYREESETLEGAVREAIGRVRGTYGLAVISADDPDILVAARQGSPLVIGIGDEDYFVASDVSAIIAHTQRVVYLDDREMAVIGLKGYEIKTVGNSHRDKEEVTLDWTPEQAEKGGFPHFMLKEIFEQPESFADAIRGRLIPETGMARLGGFDGIEERLRAVERIVIVACGTSYHAGLVGEYMLEEYAGIPTEVEYASEFRYRKPLVDERTAVIAISQSGETADTLAAVREAREKGALTLGIVNVVGSTIARETDAGIYNHAGPEVSVASTKAFTSQLAILSLIVLFLGRQRSLSLVMGQRIARELMRIPEHIRTTLGVADQVRELADQYRDIRHIFYLGRKYHFPVALEGALKIKEIAYVTAQGYPTGEMKHGPIALVGPDMLSVIVAPSDSVYEKNASGIEEIKARDGRVLAIITDGNDELNGKVDDILRIPKTLEMLAPVLSVIPLQLMAYYTSVAYGNDVDRPRNLAKSVTVE